MRTDSFIKTNGKYGEGIALDDYNGQWSLVKCREDDTGTPHDQWCYPQFKRKPADKAIPHKLVLGDSLDEAIQNLRTLGTYLIKLSKERRQGDSGPGSKQDQWKPDR